MRDELLERMRDQSRRAHNRRYATLHRGGLDAVIAQGASVRYAKELKSAAAARIEKQKDVDPRRVRALRRAIARELDDGDGRRRPVREIHKLLRENGWQVGRNKVAEIHADLTHAGST
jgi:hypothetical protein